jgi:hypothetical protein
MRKWLNRAVFDTSHKITSATLTSPTSISTAASQLGTLVVAACAVRTTGVHRDQADIAAEAAHDRRHEVPQYVAEYAEGLHVRRCKLQCLPRPYSGQARDRACSGVPPPPDSAWPQAGIDQSDHRSAALLLRDHASGQKELAEQIPFARKEDALPTVLTQDEVVRLLKAEPNLKMRTALTAIYAAGLRVSEVVALKAKDIDSTRMVIQMLSATWA